MVQKKKKNWEKPQTPHAHHYKGPLVEKTCKSTGTSVHIVTCGLLRIIMYVRRLEMANAAAQSKLEDFLELAGSLAERLVYVYIDEGHRTAGEGVTEHLKKTVDCVVEAGFPS
jgi:hypothetical protein